MHQAATQLDVPLHLDKTYACVEGPRLGTRAESFFLRSTGADLVGMTNVPEAFLAREAQLCYISLAIATDYDCWKEEPNHHASAQDIMALYQTNLSRIRNVLTQFVTMPSSSVVPEPCTCRSALANAFMGNPETLTAEQRRLLTFLQS